MRSRPSEVIVMLLFVSTSINFENIHCSGRIEIQIDHVYNIYGTLMNGSCCEGRRSVNESNFCTGTCHTYLIFCVGVSPTDCKYGKIVTPVLGRRKNSLRFPISEDIGEQAIRDQVNKMQDSNLEDVSENEFKNLLTFTIPNEPNKPQKDFYVKMEARHRKLKSAGSPGLLISKQSYILKYMPHNIWKTEPYIERGADVIFHIRTVCDPHYYLPTCQRHCEEHHDKNLHWRCLSDGSRECLPGWEGLFCDKALCNQTCDPKYGGCIGPNVCGCPYGYKGINCDECIVDPTCVNAHCITAHQCLCNEGWGGRKCHLDLDICRHKKCRNGGICVPKQDMDYGGYTCQCTDGYGGEHCEIKTSPCHSSPCKNNGTCRETAFDKKYNCICPAGMSEKNCSKDMDDCRRQCRNNATCVDKLNSFYCECKAGYSGHLCEINRNDCASFPCHHNGICIDLNGSYKCVCEVGYYGDQCDYHLDWCASKPCENNGNCTHGYHCDCHLNRTRREGNIQSTVSSQCHPNSCKHNATCIIDNGNQICLCRKGYEGRFCEIDTDICKNVTCLNSGICFDRINDFECLCKDGFSGRNCEINIDDCASSPCKNGGKCLDGINSFTCACPPGFQSHDCSSIVKECVDVVCQHGGSCVDGINTSSCECRSGYYGNHCEYGPDFCHQYHCGEHGVCVTINESSYCTCLAGYTGANCSQKISACADYPCKNGGVCIDTKNSYTCSCSLGYHGDQCQFNDSCVSDRCMNGGVCVKIDNDYHCQCPKYTYGKQCDQAVNSCNIPVFLNNAKNMSLIMPAGYCTEHGSCHPLKNGAFKCRCDNGWAGGRCQLEIDLCINNFCENQATCINIKGGYKCECREGFEGVYCQKNIDDCASSPCENGGKCIDMKNDFLCQCKDGWKGKTCLSNVSHCMYPNPCKNGYCTDLGDTFRCKCNDNYAGPTCNIFLGHCHTEKCLNGGTCLNNLTSYRCKCRPGFVGDHCEKETEECALKPCLNGGICVEGPNMYLCECPAGYHGVNCGFEIDECASLPCPWYMECVDLIGSYRCECPVGRSGEKCQYQDNMRSCEVGNITHNHNESWKNKCYQCICIDGKVKCNKQHCQENNCNERRRNPGCSCFTKMDADCITPPCISWEECYKEIAVKEGNCKPDIEKNQLNFNCAKVIMTFRKDLLPLGVILEQLCEEFRYLSLFDTYRESEIRLQCSRAVISNRVNEIIMSVHSDSNAADVAMNMAKTFSSQAYDDSLLHSFLESVIGITVERQFQLSYQKQSQGASAYLVPLAAGSASTALLLLFIVINCALKKRRREEELAQNILFTKKKNVLFHKPCEKIVNKERSLSKGDMQRSLLDANMYIAETGKKFMPVAVVGKRDPMIV